MGYTDYVADGKVIGILKDGVSVPAAEAPAEIDIVLDQTPFWAEQGGQLADHGTISVAGGGLVDVTDVQMPVKGLFVHRGTLTEGSIALDDSVRSAIDIPRREQIARAHTATHMVHKALHEYLGSRQLRLALRIHLLASDSISATVNRCQPRSFTISNRV